MKRNRSFIAAGIVVLLLIFGGPAVYAASSSAEKQTPTADYRYNPVGKPDPFRPFVEKELLLRKKVEKAVAVSIFPLQRAGIDQFILVGIAGDAERRLAVVETREGKGRYYPLELGTIIGPNKGKVVEIRSDLIVVEEAIPGRAGQKVNRIIKKLRRDEEEGTP